MYIQNCSNIKTYSLQNHSPKIRKYKENINNDKSKTLLNIIRHNIGS